MMSMCNGAVCLNQAWWVEGIVGVGGGLNRNSETSLDLNLCERHLRLVWVMGVIGMAGSD